MKRGTSLYLDLVRFSAAVMVFLEHFREHTRNSFGAFWRSHPFWYSHIDPYSQTAVIVFFVLSGYVIAHVLATRERTLIEYSASRFARLYSVALPALLLTAATNYLEAVRIPHAFDSYGGPAAISLSYLGTALFVSHFWPWPDLEPANAPFWSLSFEVAYYIAIALLVFARGRFRVASLIVLSLLAGPTIVLLAPVWFLGYGTYHVSKRWRLGAGSAILIWLGSAFLLTQCANIEMQLREPLSFLRIPDSTVGGLLASYAAAICFAANVLAFNAFSERTEPLLRRFAGFIRWLGSMTFALYLFHQPILSFFTVYNVYSMGIPSPAAQAALMIGATFLVVATLGRFCEQSKGAYKRFFLSMWGRAATVRLRHVAQTP